MRKKQSSRTTPRGTRRRKASGTPLGRDAWLVAARQALIEEGTAGVEVNKLAKRLGVSRGGFYWFFKSRTELLDALIRYWADSGTTLFEKILEHRGNEGMDQYQALSELWLEEKDYDPAWDGAIRDWARTSESVRKIVSAVDQQRIAIFEKMFHNMGYKGTEAHVRARVLYYHQVGYYALGVHESRQERWALVPFYRKILTGKDQ
jgi:AcrR family transcriptional regulator